MITLPSKLNDHEQIKTVGVRTSSARNFYELEIEYQFQLLQERDDSPENLGRLDQKIRNSQIRAQAIDAALNSKDSTWASVEVFNKAWSKRFDKSPHYEGWYRLFHFY
jgi:hypothetical protein